MVKKTVLIMMMLVLLSIYSYAIMPTEALSWVISVKDGSWTVKALGAAGGGQAAEAMSWAIDPQGKITSTGMGELNKLCKDCISASKFLMDPASGVTDMAMQQAIQSNKELGVIQEISAMRSQLSQLGMQEGQVKLENDKGNLYITEMSDIKFTGRSNPNEVLEALAMENLNGVKAKTVEKKTLIEPLPEEEMIAGGPVKETVVSKDKTTVLGKMGKNSYVEMDDENKNVVNKASIVTQEGESYKINGEEFKGSNDCKIQVEKTVCKDGKCTTSMTIEAAPQKEMLGLKPEGTTGVDQVSEVTMCGQTYKMVSGSKLSVDVGDDGCTLKKGTEIKYSNKIVGQNFKFKNMEFTTDNQKYDHQEGMVKFDGKTLEGTLKNVKLGDTEINVGGDLTKRKSQVTDKIEVNLDERGNFLSASINSKERPVFLSHNGVNLFENGFKTKDTFFTVKPVTITAGKDDYTIRTPYHDYILSKPVKEMPKVEVSEKINEELSSYDTALAIKTSRPQPKPSEELQDWWQRHKKEFEKDLEKDLDDYWQRHKTEFNNGEVEIYKTKPAYIDDYWGRHKKEFDKDILVEYDPMLGGGELPYTYYNERNGRFNSAAYYDFVTENDQVTEKGARLGNIGVLWKESHDMYVYRGVDKSGNLEIYKLKNENGALYYQGKPFEIKKGDYIDNKLPSTITSSDYWNRHKKEIIRSPKPISLSDEEWKEILSKG